MNYRIFMPFTVLLQVFTFVAFSLFLSGCGGSGDNGSHTGDVSVKLDDKPSLFFLFNSKKDTDSAGRDTYFSFVGETVDFPPHIFSNSEHTRLDISESYWADSAGNVIQNNNHAIQFSDSHKPSVKACMIPKLSNGKRNSVTCVTFEVRALPSLTQKLRSVSAFTDNDHFQAGIQLSEMEANDIRTTQGTIWQYRWLDKDGNVLKKSGEVITGYKLDYVDIDVSIKTVKVCVFDIVTQQCVQESDLVVVPSNNVPIVTILDITGQYKQGGKVSPESRTSYAYTQPAADFNYEWTVAGGALLDDEIIAPELTLKDASYFGKDITVCMQRAYTNFTGTETTLTAKVCKTKQFTESDVQVTASYDYSYNLLAQSAPLVFSGKFNGIDEIDYSTFKLTYQGKLLSQGTDYELTDTFGHNDFTFKILSQNSTPTTEYGSVLTLQCEFGYKNKLYSCIGGSNPSDTVSIYTTGGLPELKSEVIGSIAEKNRVAFQRCETGDRLTWWLKDKGTDIYVQTGSEDVIEKGNFCYGNSPKAKGNLYLEESWAGKSLKLIVKRARNGLSDERIQILDIDLGEISE
jgi:hypothetical protein